MKSQFCIYQSRRLEDERDKKRAIMKPDKHRKQQSFSTLGGWTCLMMVVILALALGAPYAPAFGAQQQQQQLPPAVSSNVSATIIVNADDQVKQVASLGGLQTSKPAPTGPQARTASSYLASRAASGLQLKRSPPKKPVASGALGDTVSLETAIDSQMDLQTAAGEHKKYILVKKKPKHKKIKMEVYKPKMKYKKIKMKVPVKKMKKKKVKGYLVKKEKHHHEY